jgi:hypothetical protein
MSILILPVLFVNFDFDFAAPDADDFRPTAGPDFTPTPEELAEAAELLNVEGEPDWDALADDSHALAVVSTGYAWL